MREQACSAASGRGRGVVLISTENTVRLDRQAKLQPLLEDQLCFAIYSASHALARRYKPILARLDLTYPQYLCMLVLWETNDLTVGAVGQRLHLDSGTLTPLLKRLEQAGLVTRVRDRDDERQVRITLTAAGLAMRNEADAVVDEIVCATGLPVSEIERMRKELVVLRNRLNAGTP